jgi:hypothetical protein
MIGINLDLMILEDNNIISTSSDFMQNIKAIILLIIVIFLLCKHMIYYRLDYEKVIAINSSCKNREFTGLYLCKYWLEIIKSFLQEDKIKFEAELIPEVVEQDAERIANLRRKIQEVTNKITEIEAEILVKEKAIRDLGISEESITNDALPYLSFINKTKYIQIIPLLIYCFIYINVCMEVNFFGMCLLFVLGLLLSQCAKFQYIRESNYIIFVLYFILFIMLECILMIGICEIIVKIFNSHLGYYDKDKNLIIISKPIDKYTNLTISHSVFRDIKSLPIFIIKDEKILDALNVTNGWQVQYLY